jgi:predicted AlkP superfamily pyrophosphatase or phosphodiesterase
MSVFAQKNKQHVQVVAKENKQPLLVVGLLVDQMRWDFLYRYQSKYSQHGFKRLMREGFSCEQTMIPYMPTYTAPGHTCVYTGSVPAIHGIVGNSWFDRKLNKNVYCTDDSTTNTIGSNSSQGKMSPVNLWTTTITDELRLSNNFKSKVIGIALKDRGAILPTGHTANGAYWYDDKEGKWITSSYYMKSLPVWVNNFNAANLPGKYMSGEWNTLLPIKEYTESTEDNSSHENTIPGIDSVTFPYYLSGIKKNAMASFKTTPFANNYTLEFAKAAIQNEQLGKNTVPDFLAVSISSTDYIGHTFGPNSVEIEDTYLRLDLAVADFLNYLDSTVGKGKYLLFLTADHGVAHNPGFMQEHRLSAGNFKDAVITKEINDEVFAKLGIKNAVDEIMNYQVYINKNIIERREEINTMVINHLKEKEFVLNAFDLKSLNASTMPTLEKNMFSNGYNVSRSGDIQFVCKPGYFDGEEKGSTHGLWNPYEAHIPLIFFGNGIAAGKTYQNVEMTDISATLAALLNLQMPSGCIGKVVTEVFK